MDDGRLRRTLVDTAAPGLPHGTSPSDRAGTSSAARRLRRIPLTFRMVIYGVFFLAFVLGGLPWLAYQIDVHVPAWRIELGLPWRGAGAVVFAAFLVIYLYCSYVLTHHGEGAYVEFDPPAKFVAVGPYRWVRNPVAASVVGMLAGEAVALSSIGIMLLFLVSLPLAHAQVVCIEEPLLRKRFGPDYLEYLRRVPRWLPRPPRDDPG